MEWGKWGKNKINCFVELFIVLKLFPVAKNLSDVNKCKCWGSFVLKRMVSEESLRKGAVTSMRAKRAI
jgi:hypothetical protein